MTGSGVPSDDEIVMLRGIVTRHGVLTSLTYGIPALGSSMILAVTSHTALWVSVAVFLLAIALTWLAQLPPALRTRHGMPRSRLTLAVETVDALPRSGRLRRSGYPLFLVGVGIFLWSAAGPEQASVYGAFIGGVAFGIAVKLLSFPRLLGPWQNDLAVIAYWTTHRDRGPA